MKEIIVSRDVAEALQDQFPSSIKDVFENSDDCDPISIGGRIESCKRINYNHMKESLFFRSVNSEEEANEIIEDAKLALNVDGPVNVKWEA